MKGQSLFPSVLPSEQVLRDKRGNMHRCTVSAMHGETRVRTQYRPSCPDGRGRRGSQRFPTVPPAS